jgi:polysaccharide chain length determinant protein (PEP-CTERM system associated)
MQEGSEAINLIQFWDIVRRRRRSIFLAFFLMWAIVCALSWLLPARYRSETTILIEQPKVPQQYVVSNVGSDLQDRLQTLTQQILSRTRLQHIIDDFHLYSEERARMGTDDVIEKMRKDIKVDLIQAPSKPAELTAFNISYSGSSGQLVQQVTSRLTSLFIEENLQAREQQSENTTAFLDKSLQEARTRLEEQEKRLKEFKAQFIGQLPGELQSNLQILSGLQARLQQANEGLDRSEQQKLYLSSLLGAYRETPSLATAGLGNAAGSPVDVDSELAHLKAQLADMKSRYTDHHPAVLQLRDQIAKAEKLKAEMDKDKTATGKGDEAGLPESRVVAEIQSQLKGIELDIQNRKKEIAGLAAEMQEYQNRLSKTPVREQQMADLSRDYDQSRANYESLLAKKNQSALATDLEKTQQGEQFAVLDPPSLPTGPYFPNRLLFTLGGLAAGLAAAAGTAFLRETLDDRLHADVDIVSVSKLPVLVAIPPLVTARDVRRGRWRAVREVACATAGVAVIAASTLLAYYSS